jgi:glycosyltransferase involved in cell wall biosynthesis
MPLPLVTPEFDPTLTKESFGLDNRFVFLFSFDFLSVLKRKNTLGLVESFCAAFQVNEGPLLVLKSINGNLRLNELERLKWAIKDRPDIVLIDEYFDAGKTAALMAVSDCYVSLHRSEGLGLTMAEAMLLGKPVIATGYSGNMDFMNEANSILISWSPVKVGPDAEGYPEDAIWAEPDLEEAAKAMHKVFSDPEFASRLGDEARRDLGIRFSPTTTGQKMKVHLFSA